MTLERTVIDFLARPLMRGGRRLIERGWSRTGECVRAEGRFWWGLALFVAARRERRLQRERQSQKEHAS